MGGDDVLLKNGEKIYEGQQNIPCSTVDKFQVPLEEIFGSTDCVESATDTMTTYEKYLSSKSKK